MAGLSRQEYAFLRRRRRQLSAWPLLGGGALFVLLVLYAWLTTAYPQLANPVYVYRALASNALAAEVLSTLALLAPVLVTVLFAAVGGAISAVFSFMRREKRLLDIVDKLVGGGRD